MNLLFLLSHVPNPRIYKRMKIAKNNHNVSTIYWRRSFESFETFFQDKAIEKYEVIGEGKSQYGLSVFKRIMLILKFMFRALGVMKKIRPSIIHCEHLDMLFISYIFKKIYNRDVKIIYEVADLHEIVYSDSNQKINIFQRKIFKMIEKYLSMEIEKIIITSPYFWDDYYCDFIPEEKVLFIPNAPEKKVFENYSSKRNDKLTIGFIGAVRYSKQLKMLIDVAQETNLIDVLIAGNGSAYKEISDYSNNLNCVKMYGPYDYEKEIAMLYSKIDIVYSVYDSRNKNVRIALPNRLYEAIVTEKPIIASRNTKLGEFVKKNKIGFLVDSQEKDDLKNLVLNILNEKTNLNNCKENCNKIKENYYMDFYNSKLIELYLNV